MAKKATRKTVRKVVKKTSLVAETASSPVMAMKENLMMSNKKVWVIAAVIVLAGLLFYFRGSFVVATVNNRPVWRWTLIHELEKGNTQTVVDGLITKSLILQEASKNKTEVTDAEVTAEIDKLRENFKTQGQDLEALMTAQNVSMDQLQEQIRVQKLVEKLAVKEKVTVSAEEVAKFIEDNKAFLSGDLNKPETKAQVEADARKQLEQDKINTQIQTWLQQVRQNAKINYFNPKYVLPTIAPQKS